MNPNEWNIRYKVIVGLFVLMSGHPMVVAADLAEVQTPKPVIHLEDLAEEPDGLGWCLDTQGRGLSDRMHVHSCKPRGGDVQFFFNTQGQIEAHAFAGKCVELVGVGAGQSVGLQDCSNGKALQLFRYDATAMTIQPMMDASLCLAAGEAINPAGPFSSKTLLSAECAGTKPQFKRWVVVE